MQESVPPVYQQPEPVVVPPTQEPVANSQSDLYSLLQGNPQPEQPAYQQPVYQQPEQPAYQQPEPVVVPPQPDPVYPPYGNDSVQVDPINSFDNGGYGGHGGHGNDFMPPTPPENNLAGAIVATVLCWPLGIPAIVNAAKVNKLWAAGDYVGAQDAAVNAVKWKNIAIVLGIIAWTINIIMSIILNCL